MTLPLHVFLDTSSLHPLTPDSVMARRLMSLSKSGVIKLHIPWIVEHEIRTQLHGLRTMYRDYAVIANWFPQPERDKFKTILDQARELISKSNTLTDRGFSEWLREIDAVRDLPADGHALEAFRRYFAGESPFKSIKQRSDLPDAFIYLTISSFAASQNNVVHVVVNDDKLRLALEKIEKVQVHTSLKSIFSLPMIETKITLSELIFAFNEGMENYNSKLIRKIGTCLLDEKVTSPIDQEYPGNHYISDYGIIEDLHFWETRAELISDNVFQVPFSCATRGGKTSGILHQHDIYMADPSECYEIEDFSDEDYASCEIEADFLVDGIAIVEIGKNGDLIEAIDDIDISIKEVRSQDI